MAPPAVGSLPAGAASSQPSSSEDAMLIAVVPHHSAHDSRSHASGISQQRARASSAPGNDDGKQEHLTLGVGTAVRLQSSGMHMSQISQPSEEQQLSDDASGLINDSQGGSEEPEQDSGLDSNDAGSEEMDMDPPLTSQHCLGRKGRFADTIEASDDYDSEEGEFTRGQLTFCTNCTSSLFDPYCSACGHHADDDKGLFDTGGMMDQPAPLAAAAGPVALLWDERMEAHEEGRASPHPERPDRIRAVMARLQTCGLTDQCVRVDCQEATMEQLSCVHTPELMEFVKSMAHGLPPPAAYSNPLTSDTYINSSTYLCARLAAGGAASVAAMVARGEASHGAAIVRPPGHHAESNMAMGFCFFNNAAVAARAAQAAGAQRVLILDWDIHHGNGTQHIFEDDPSVMYMSLHRWDNGTFYPGTGSPEEVGTGPGAGYTVNVAWNGSNLHNTDYMCAFERVLLPVARTYRPDLILISAGFDAADGDPIGGCRVTPEGFAHMTALLKSIAPIVLLLEGGYNLAATATSTEACLRVLLGQQPPPLPGPPGPSRAGELGIVSSLHVHRRFWPCLRAIYAESVKQLIVRQASMGVGGSGGVVASLPPSDAAGPRVSVVCAPPPSQGVPPLVNARRAAAASATAAAARHDAALGRKWQLIQQIRKRARQAWWRRHKRVVQASMAGVPLVLPPQPPRRSSV